MSGFGWYLLLVVFCLQAVAVVLGTYWEIRLRRLYREHQRRMSQLLTVVPRDWDWGDPGADPDPDPDSPGVRAHSSLYDALLEAIASGSRGRLPDRLRFPISEAPEPPSRTRLPASGFMIAEIGEGVEDVRVVVGGGGGVGGGTGGSAEVDADDDAVAAREVRESGQVHVTGPDEGVVYISGHDGRTRVHGPEDLVRNLVRNHLIPGIGGEDSAPNTVDVGGGLDETVQQSPDLEHGVGIFMRTVLPRIRRNPQIQAPNEQHTVVHRDETGVLFQVSLQTHHLPTALTPPLLHRRRGSPGSPWRAYVRVESPPPEPGYSPETHYLSVPPTIRTAREAVAWTYGFTEEQYQRVVRS